MSTPTEAVEPISDGVYEARCGGCRVDLRPDPWASALGPRATDATGLRRVGGGASCAGRAGGGEADRGRLVAPVSGRPHFRRGDRGAFARRSLGAPDRLRRRPCDGERGMRVRRLAAVASGARVGGRPGAGGVGEPPGAERLRAHLPASIAVREGLATASINDVLRRQRKEQLAPAVSALGPDIEAAGCWWMGTPERCWPVNRASRTCWWWAPELRAAARRSARSVPNALVRSAESPIVSYPAARRLSRGLRARRVRGGSRSGSAPRGCACRASRARWPGGGRRSSC
jgi:hypothetical protein